MSYNEPYPTKKLNSRNYYETTHKLNQLNEITNYSMLLRHGCSLKVI